jgi:single-stranded DNA-binding protein
MVAVEGRLQTRQWDDEAGKRDPEALRYQEEGHPRGKVVITV